MRCPLHGAPHTLPGGGNRVPCIPDAREERMLKYILKRLAQSLLTILLVVSVVFILMRLMPSENFFTDDELLKFSDKEKYEKLERMGMMKVCPTCGGTGLVDGLTCSECGDEAAIAKQTADSYQKPGTGYVKRSMLLQLAEFYGDMLQFRVYNTAKDTEVKSISSVSIVPYIKARLAGEDPFRGKVKDNYDIRLKFNLGKSTRIEKNQYVTKIIADKMGMSMTIGMISLAISLVLGVVLGVVQARYKDGIFDHIGTGYTVFVNAVPHLVIYTLIMVLGNSLFGLPMRYDDTKGNVELTMVLPIICLSIGSIAGYMLWTRRYMVDELNKDYIRLAKLKGLSERRVLFRHVLKNAFVPLAQYLPYSILLTVGGSLLVEKFFAVPGMGFLLPQAIGRYDLPLVQGTVLLYATMGILGVFLGDLLMTFIDPRIKLTGKGDVR